MGRAKKVFLTLVAILALSIPGMAFARPAPPPRHMPHRHVQVHRPTHHYIRHHVPNYPRHLWGDAYRYGGYYGYRYPTLHGRDYGNMLVWAIVSGAANAYANRVINPYYQQQVIVVPATTTTTTETVIYEQKIRY